MDMTKIQDAVNIPELAAYLEITTQAGAAALQEKTGYWCSNPKVLKQRSYEFATMQRILHAKPALVGALDHQFSELHLLEPDLAALTTEPSELETEAFNELLFLKSWSKPLNFVPLLLSLWSILRVYVFPGLAILMPLAMLILPFIMIRFIFNVPLTVGRYTTMISAIFSGQVASLFNPAAVLQPISTNTSPFSIDIFQLFKSGLLIGTIIQSFLQPYWAFRHLYSIDTIIIKKAAALQRCKDIYESIRTTLKEHGFTFAKNPFAADITDERQLVALAHLHPVYLKVALKRLGALEVLFRAAKRYDLVPVNWIATAPMPRIELHGAYDYRVSKGRVPFSINLSDSNHALLTGPNRGGKSTTLRAILTSCALAHTYGFAFAEAAKLTPLTSMYVCLTPEDLPGEKSRFEREIEFTAQTLRHTHGSALVLLDELYHSTNPPDAERACKLYTERLWAKHNILSVISTHLFEFVESAPSPVQRLCCPAIEQKDGALTYSYRLGPGVCRVSSVGELLKENGLWATCPLVAAKPQP
jgi:MutS domain V